MKSQQNINKSQVLPSAIPLEEVVLGACMLDKKAISYIEDILNPEHFYVKKHQDIYEVMQSMYRKQLPIDLLTVYENVKKLHDNINPSYLAELTTKVASSANIEYHARIIQQKFVNRQLIEVAYFTLKTSSEDKEDVFEILEGVEKSVMDIHTGLSNNNAALSGEVAHDLLKELEDVESGRKGPGLFTGINTFDDFFGSMKGGQLHFIAARPGMGKTAYALSQAKNISHQGNGVGIFSLEMSKKEMSKRIISNEMSLSIRAINNHLFNEDERTKYIEGIEWFSKTNVIIDDTPGIDIYDLKAKARRMKLYNDVSVIFVDYLQLITSSTASKKGNREQEVSFITRELKGLAKELDIPIICLAQLSRAVETRGGSKIPQLSDLRESGSIEQDADSVSFIYRAEYYKIYEDENGESTKGVADIHVAKNRHGKTSDEPIKLKFEGQYQRFCDIDDFVINPIEAKSDNNNQTLKNFGIIDPSRVAKVNDEDEIPF